MYFAEQVNVLENLSAGLKRSHLMGLVFRLWHFLAVLASRVLLGCVCLFKYLHHLGGKFPIGNQRLSALLNLSNDLAANEGQMFDLS